MKLASGILAVTLAAVLSASSAWAQATTSDAPKPPRPPSPCVNPSVDSYQSFVLHNVSQASDANEIYTALRNLLPAEVKSFLVSNQNTIIMCGTSDEIALAQRLLKDLDRPKKNYRLTYTVTEMDGTQRVGTQHFSMILASGQQTSIKQGSKVPVATGSYSGGASANATVQTQFTYLDIGMNFDATLVTLGDGVTLKSKVEQSSVAEQSSIAGVQEPVIRQTSLAGSSVLTPGKPLMLGSVDITGSTRRLDIEVVMEQLP
jgi:type II secretory pathway component GspD/PulD (secretin)